MNERFDLKPGDIVKIQFPDSAKAYVLKVQPPTQAYEPDICDELYDTTRPELDKLVKIDLYRTFRFFAAMIIHGLKELRTIDNKSVDAVVYTLACAGYFHVLTKEDIKKMIAEEEA